MEAVSSKKVSGDPSLFQVDRNTNQDRVSSHYCCSAYCLLLMKLLKCIRLFSCILYRLLHFKLQISQVLFKNCKDAVFSRHLKFYFSPTVFIQNSNFYKNSSSTSLAFEWLFKWCIVITSKQSLKFSSCFNCHCGVVTS